MTKDNRCKICNKYASLKICESCSYLLTHGASEITIRAMLSDKQANTIWKENKKLANKLALAYYDSVLDAYDPALIRKDTKENFGFNTFSEGITLGLDIVMPLLDKFNCKKAKDKIDMMLKIREDEK